jgi:hypothetical protein
MLAAGEFGIKGTTGYESRFTRTISLADASMYATIQTPAFSEPEHSFVKRPRDEFRLGMQPPRDFTESAGDSSRTEGNSVWDSIGDFFESWFGSSRTSVVGNSTTVIIPEATCEAYQRITSDPEFQFLTTFRGSTVTMPPELFETLSSLGCFDTNNYWREVWESRLEVVGEHSYEINEDVEIIFNPLTVPETGHTDYVPDSLPSKSEREYLGVTNGLSLHTS